MATQRDIFGQPQPIIPSVTVPPPQDTSTLEIPSRYRGGRRPDQSTLELDPRSQGNDDAIIEQITNSIIAQESSGRPSVTGQKGEIGLGQIMPSTAAQYGVTPEQLRDPNINRALTKRIVGDLYHRFNGNLFLTAAAYNAGPGNVHRGIIPASTRNYVGKVLQGLGQLGEGTAYAEEPPSQPGAPSGPLTKAPTTYLRGGPSAGGGALPQKPVDMNRLRGMIAHLPPERQQQIMQQAQQHNQQLSQPTGGAPAGQPKPAEAPPPSAQERIDTAEDIKHPWYGYIRRPGTAAVDWASQFLMPKKGTFGDPSGYTPEQVKQLRSWAGHTFFPQTPTMAALQLATLPMSWAETAPELAPEAEQALGSVSLSRLAQGEGFGALRQGLRSLVNTVPKRVLGMGGVGAATSAATGESPWQGFKTGVEFQTPGEILGSIGGGLGRIFGKKSLLTQTEGAISKAMESNLPTNIGPGGFNTDRPFNLRDWKTPDKAFRQVQDMLRPERDMIHMDPRVQKERFWMPIVEGGVKPSKWKWGWVGMKNAEEQLTKLGELGYLKSGEWKTAGYSRDARKLFDGRKAYIAGKLPQDIRQMWELTRDQSGAAAAYRRLFQETKAIDPNTGELDQAKLAAGIKENWGDLERQLGREGVQNLWEATTRLKPKWYTRGSPHIGAYEDKPGHLKPRLGIFPKPNVHLFPETYQPIGNVPIWMYPPKSAVAAVAGPYTQQKFFKKRPPPLR